MYFWLAIFMSFLNVNFLSSKKVLAFNLCFVTNPGCFSPIPVRSGRFGPGCFGPNCGRSFRPSFEGGSFQPDLWGELFRPDLFISRNR